METAELIVIGGIVAIGGFVVYKAVSQPTQQVASACSGDWTDLIDPRCWYSSLTTGISNEANNFTNELNTVLIILAVVVILVIALLAYGPGTEHIARGAALFA